MAPHLKQKQAEAPQLLVVNGRAEVQRAAASAKKLSLAMGFALLESEEIALATTELASNLVQHATGGTIRLTPLHQAEQIGMRIEAEDEGRGIPDPERAIADGFSTEGTLGLGLGAVNRLMDDMEFCPRDGGGLRVVCQRWRRPARAGQFLPLHLPLDLGAATRARRSARENGDAFVLKRWGTSALSGVIDGLGHGLPAQRAARAARHYVEEHFDQPLENLFRGVDRACRATRGVVMALARLDLIERRLLLGIVGNVETRVLSAAPGFMRMCAGACLDCLRRSHW